MKLSDLINSPEAHHVSGRAVSFKVIGRNKQGETVQADARAVFRFVSEQERADILARSSAAVAERYAGKTPPPRAVLDEESFHLLHAALRDESPPHAAFADTVLHLRNSLVFDEAQRVYADYQQWITEEFPDRVSEEDMAILVDEAKKNLLLDLLKSCGYRRTLSVLHSLAQSGGLATQT